MPTTDSNLFFIITDLACALTIKGQNICASTQIFCKEIFHFDAMDSNK